MIWRSLHLLLLAIVLIACGKKPMVIGSSPTVFPSPTAVIIPTETPILPTLPPADELNDADDVLAYLVGRRHDVALVSYTVNPDGSIADDAPTIMHQPHEPMAFGPTLHILTLAGYAWEVEQGLLDPDQLFKLTDVEAWYLPYLDGGAHRRALAGFVISSDDLGYSRQLATIRLEKIVEMMVKFGDFAAADFVLDLLQPETLQTIFDETGLEGVAPPASFLGSMLLFAQISQEPDLDAYLDELEGHGPAERAALMQSLIDDYQADPSRYYEWIRWVSDKWPDHALQQRYFQHLTPQGTAMEFAQLMAQIATGTCISPTISERIRMHLEWHMFHPSNQAAFEHFGGLAGGLPSIRTEAFSMLSKTDPWQKRPRVVVLLLRNLSESDDQALWETQALTLIEMDVGSNPEFIQKAATVLNQP